MSEQELDSMLGEIGGPCNYENMVKCFETKMSGFVNDPDDLVVGAFKSYNEECKFAFVFRYTMSLGVTFFKAPSLFQGKQTPCRAAGHRSFERTLKTCWIWLL